MYEPTTKGTFLERLAGALAMTTFSACYFYALLWLPAVRGSGHKCFAAVVVVPTIEERFLT